MTDSAPPLAATPDSRERSSVAAEPFAVTELRLALRRPMQMVDLALASPERIAANIAEGRGLTHLVAALFVAGSLFAIPYGLAHGFASFWKIVPLFLGSTLLCVPSLHVFGSYLGIRMSWGQSLALALCLPAAAAMFTFGFAPVLGFLRATMEGGDERFGWGLLSTVLLMVSLAAGVGQVGRCLVRLRAAAAPAFRILIAVWLLELVYVMLRMLDVLDLRA